MTLFWVASHSINIHSIICHVKFTGSDVLNMAVPEGWPDFLELLRMSKEYKATDARDELYALLGTMEPYIACHIKPHRAKFVQAVYEYFTLAIFRTKGIGTGITQGGVGWTQDNILWSSWIPDLRRKSVKNYMAKYNDSGTRSTFIGFQIQAFCVVHLYLLMKSMVLGSGSGMRLEKS